LLLSLAPTMAAQAGEMSSAAIAARLEAAIRAHEADYEARGRWPYVEDGPVFGVGDISVRTNLLRSRLAATGDLEPAPVERVYDVLAEATFDVATREGLLAFQRRHGLVETGEVDRTTLYHLDVPNPDRIAQLRRNLGRIRALRDVPEGRRIVVNIPAFRAWLIEDERLVASHKVVVGSCFRQTPFLSSAVESVQLNPTWSVPQHIAVTDKLPIIRSDPSFLARNGFRLYESWGDGSSEVDPKAVDWRKVRGRFPYRLVQSPGRGNALGRVKLNFANSHAIYMHDTSAPELFAFTQRAFSSGCVRVEDPVAVAAFVLDDPDRDVATLTAAVERRSRETLRVSRPVPIDIVYWTAWVDPDETVQFRRDVYGRDPLPDDAPPTTPADCRVPESEPARQPVAPKARAVGTAAEGEAGADLSKHYGGP
jgi:murein L,D-transpeptidase YcbB/YkuD